MAASDRYSAAGKAALGTRIQGLREAKAAFQALPEIVRDAMLTATETTCSEVARAARERLSSSPSIRTRTLYNAIAWKVTKTNGRGRVGIARQTTTLVAGGRKLKVRGILVPGRGGSARTADGAKRIDPVRYAHIVEFGARHMPAEPFMQPAAESQQALHIQRCRDAGRVIERNAAALGARTL